MHFRRERTRHGEKIRKEDQQEMKKDEGKDEGGAGRSDKGGWTMKGSNTSTLFSPSSSCIARPKKKGRKEGRKEG